MFFFRFLQMVESVIVKNRERFHRYNPSYLLYILHNYNVLFNYLFKFNINNPLKIDFKTISLLIEIFNLVGLVRQNLLMPLHYQMWLYRL